LDALANFLVKYHDALFEVSPDGLHYSNNIGGIRVKARAARNSHRRISESVAPGPDVAPPHSKCNRNVVDELFAFYLHKRQ